MVFTVRDFIDRNQIFKSDTDFMKHKVFDIDKSKGYVVFNKLYDAVEKGAVAIQLHESIEIAECLPIINDYQDWLNSEDCKNQLIAKFCEFVNSYSDKMLTVGEVIDNNWYDGLEINSVLIEFSSDCKNIRYHVGCLDNWHIMYVNVREYQIISVFDDYADPKHGTGYDGVW